MLDRRVLVRGTLTGWIVVGLLLVSSTFVLSMVGDANHWDPFRVGPSGLAVLERTRDGASLGPGGLLLGLLLGPANGLAAAAVAAASRRGGDGGPEHAVAERVHAD